MPDRLFCCPFCKSDAIFDENFYRKYKPLVRFKCEKCGSNVISGKSLIKIYSREGRNKDV